MACESSQLTTVNLSPAVLLDADGPHLEVNRKKGQRSIIWSSVVYGKSCSDVLYRATVFPIKKAGLIITNSSRNVYFRDVFAGLVKFRK